MDSEEPVGDEWDVTLTVSNYPREETNGHTGSESVRRAEDIDWVAFWDEFGYPHDRKMSLTTLRLALQVSNQTDAAAIPDIETFMQNARDAGLVSEVRVKTHEIDGAGMTGIAGYRLA